MGWLQHKLGCQWNWSIKHGDWIGRHYICAVPRQVKSWPSIDLFDLTCPQEWWLHSLASPLQASWNFAHSSAGNMTSCWSSVWHNRSDDWCKSALCVSWEYARRFMSKTKAAIGALWKTMLISQMTQQIALLKISTCSRWLSAKVSWELLPLNPLSKSSRLSASSTCLL